MRHEANEQTPPSRLSEVRGHPIDDYRSKELFDIKLLQYSEDGLTIVIDGLPSDLTVEFDLGGIIGFRLLHEGDLLEFWDNDFTLGDGWLYEVTEGGWFDLESRRAGFLSHDRKGVVEYLIVTQQDCVSVLSLSAPTVQRT